MKPTAKTVLSAAITISAVSFAHAEISQEHNQWFEQGQATLEKKLSVKPNKKTAKNIILFIADGNGVTSNTAIRIFNGQLQGQTGEEYVLSYEEFPHLALAKTYNINAQTPDSAGTATAFMSGVKTKAGVIGIDGEPLRGDCKGAVGHEVVSVLELAEMAGKSTGVVTTARVTHATPAAAYAHSADRNWEDNTSITPEMAAVGCTDIAAQAIEAGLDVVFGGGRRHFLPKEYIDGEGKKGKRTDNRNLTAEWLSKYDNASFIWNQDGFDKLDTETTGPVLGLFNSSHMEYEADRAKDKGGEPSLAEMTTKAIEILDNNKKGFFLQVEAGRVDHAHHAGNAARAVTDGVAFAEAVKAAVEMTSEQDTLIIVTADHSHTLALQGYAKRGNPILGLSVGIDGQGLPKDEPNLADDGKPYTTLSYANGPGGVEGPREDLSSIDVDDVDFIQQALIPLKSSETHAGDDVAVYARGPGAWLLQGSIEQNYIFHVMDYAGKLRQKAEKASK
ncbi:MAG: alkaline phosphatase [Reinekea sp.]|jgi:alkaline phosphatase